MKTILLYGATGFSGRLIAAAATGEAKKGDHRLILAARNGPELVALARDLKMEARIFPLDDPKEIAKQLYDVDVVLNAAGPFAFTARPLLNAALFRKCHYVDINSEIDVYLTLDDEGAKAAAQNVAIVSAAGSEGGASNILLHAALNMLRKNGIREARAIRFGVSQPVRLSQGSAQTLNRLFREQVAIVRKSQCLDRDKRRREMLVVTHEPVGKLERAFDFGIPTDGTERLSGNEKQPANFEIATAENMVDTLTARVTAIHNDFSAERIESYVRMGRADRYLNQFGAAIAPYTAFPAVQALLRQQTLLSFPDGPSPEERGKEPQVIVLEIDDVFGAPLINWRWETPNYYNFTARLSLEVARRTAEGQSSGWVTPGEILGFQRSDLTQPAGALSGCLLTERLTLMEAA